MNHNEEELKKQLRTLRTSASLDPQKKESIKRALRKHAAKRRWHGKVKQSVVWLSTAAALVIVSLILLNTINNNDSTLPADDHNQSEYNGTMEGRENDSFDNEDTENNETDSNDQESQQLSVNERGNETRSIMVEGIEEEVTVTNYTLEPYGINYQLGELFSNYTVDDNKVRYYNDADNAEVTLKVVEDASLENVASDIQSAYNDEYTYIEDPSDTSQDENDFQGIQQHFTEPPQGYYVYQVEDNVLIIQYEYIIEAGDGMGPRLQALRESIEQ